VSELRPGLWHWEALHPDWRPTEPWSENMSSYAIEGLRPLLELPVEHVLATHGGPFDRAALERALRTDPQ
jgi:hypothetical protein